MHDFERWWREHFNDCPPLGRHLREAFPSRWLRTHSLPRGKRYPDGRSEEREVLRRYMAVAQEVLQDDERPWLATVLWEESPEQMVSIPELGDAPLHWSMPVAPDDYVAAGTVYVGLIPPHRTALVAIAQDACGALWASETTGEVFAPYDGGADLIVRSPARADELRRTFAEWLSPRADGL